MLFTCIGDTRSILGARKKRLVAKRPKLQETAYQPRHSLSKDYGPGLSFLYVWSTFQTISRIYNKYENELGLGLDINANSG